LLFFASALCAACYGQPPAKPAQTIRVVSWNLAWFPGKKQSATADEQKAHMEQAQQALRELKPDVLLLQEVRDWKSAEELCSVVPNLRVQFISRFQNRPQNQVIATNLPVDSGWSEEWQQGASHPPRGYVFAAIELPQKRFLLAYSLHLKSNYETDPLVLNVMKRQESVGQLLIHTQEMQKLYGARGACGLLLGGDMNTSLDDPRFAKEQTPHALIAAGFHWTFTGVPFANRITIPKKGKYADNCFDHIFTVGLGKQTASVKPYPGRSDHNPVILDLDLSKADFQPRLDTAAGLALLKAAPASPAAKQEIPVTATLSANDHEAIRAAVGKIVAVRGKVHDVGKDRSGVWFLNFDGNQRGQFKGFVNKGDVEAVMEALGGELKTRLTGKTVELRGEIVLYKEIPEIVVNGGNQIRVVEDAASGAVPPAPAATAPSEGYVASVNKEVFHKAGCKSASKISAKNLVTYKTREEAIQAGKRECKECKP
jgi:endonuclease/exonuclease/phosphatase family metal-dependent hydrolase/DNA/RNA endonuclease YhcR with UshA esterase domain